MGKTTLIHMFGQEFDQYIYLNLEKAEDQEPFAQYKNVNTLIEGICFRYDKVSYKTKSTLLFIDEIQERPELINELRYFYEEAPELFVISAGSLMEMVLTKKVKFPVGRVSFMVVKPLSFSEFLKAMGEEQAIEQMDIVPLNNFAMTKMFDLFHTYGLIGGMPQVVQAYVENRDAVALTETYESLLVSYLDDMEKYASTSAQTQLLRHVTSSFLQQAMSRITFGNFAGSNYRSREVGEAMRTLEKNMVLSLVYPTVDTSLPISPNLRRKPRLHVLDTGLINYFSKIQHLVIGSKDLTAVYQGKIVEHLVGQEMHSTSHFPTFQLHFWVRERTDANAEVDYVFPFQREGDTY